MADVVLCPDDRPRFERPEESPVMPAKTFLSQRPRLGALLLGAACALLLLVGTPASAEEEGEAKALADLAAAFPKGSSSEQISALRAAQTINTPAVSKAIAKEGLESKDGSVQLAAMRALGQMPNEESVKALEHAYRSHQAAQKDEAFFVTLITELGRLGDPGSVALLADKPFKNGTQQTSRARIYGLGNIRTKQAVEALIKGIQLQGPTARGMFSTNTDVLLPDFQTALTVLSGQDQGADRNLWTKWWRTQGKTFEVEAELPVIPARLEKRWEDFWGRPYPVEQPVDGFPTFEWVMNPTEEQVEQAVADLKDARASKNSARLLASIYTNMLIVDAKVVKAIHQAAKKQGRSVIEAAIEALGWMPDKSALKELQSVYRSHRDLYKFDNYYAGMLKAIGRHGDPSSLKILLDKPFKGLSMASGRARILGVARIREKDSVEGLMKAMNLAGGNGRRALQAGTGSQPFMGAIRLALVVLTGEDKGTSKTAWQNWWRDNKRTFKVDPKLPTLSESMRETWEEYWEEPYRS
jgi:HEAT repeat protein